VESLHSKPVTCHERSRFWSNSTVLWTVSKKSVRYCSLRTRLFVPMKVHLRAMVRWIKTVSFTSLLKIRVLLRKRHWIDQKLLTGLKHYPGFAIASSLVKKRYWPCVPQYSWDTPRACPSWSQWKWGILLSTGWGTPTFPSWHLVLRD